MRSPGCPHLSKADDGQDLSDQADTDVGVAVPLACLDAGVCLGNVSRHGAQEGDTVLCSCDGVGGGGVHHQATVLRSVRETRVQSQGGRISTVTAVVSLIPKRTGMDQPLA